MERYDKNIIDMTGIILVLIIACFFFFSLVIHPLGVRMHLWPRYWYSNEIHSFSRSKMAVRIDSVKTYQDDFDTLPGLDSVKIFYEKQDSWSAW